MRRLRATKILATLGPASSTQEMMLKLHEAGADVFRINMSHTSHDLMRELVANIRAVEKKSARPIGILLDLQGPKLRLGPMTEPVELKKHQEIIFDLDEAAGTDVRVPLPHPEIFASIKMGDVLLIDDGKVRLVTTAVEPFKITARAEVAGKLSSRKGVSLPDTLLPIKALSEKDRADLEAGLEAEVDWVALSFVQRPEDVAEVKELVRGRAGILSKIEKARRVGVS